MGSEIILLATIWIWIILLLLIFFRMAYTKRIVAFSAAISVGIIGTALPSVFNSGSDIFLFLELELLTAFVLASLALYQSHRWQLLCLFLTLALVCLCYKLRIYYDSEFLVLVAGFCTLMAPVFLTLAVVFCVGAFWEKRSIRA